MFVLQTPYCSHYINPFCVYPCIHIYSYIYTNTIKWKQIYLLSNLRNKTLNCAFEGLCISVPNFICSQHLSSYTILNFGLIFSHHFIVNHECLYPVTMYYLMLPVLTFIEMVFRWIYSSVCFFSFLPPQYYVVYGCNLFIFTITLYFIVWLFHYLFTLYSVHGYLECNLFSITNNGVMNILVHLFHDTCA